MAQIGTANNGPLNVADFNADIITSTEDSDIVIVKDNSDSNKLKQITRANFISGCGAVDYQGTWNASTNTPALASGTGTKGFYYVVSVSGSTNLDGVTDWVVGDWAIFNGTAWEKADHTDLVSSVFGRVGAVTAAANDYTWAQINKTTSDIADITTKSHTSLTDKGTHTHAQIDTHLTDQAQMYYVEKHGNDSNDGKTIGTAFLTFGAAITAASLLTPSSSNVFNIVCLDSGIYTENITLASYIHIYAPKASVTGIVNLVDDTSITCYNITNGDTACLRKASGSGVAHAFINRLIATAALNGVIGASGTIIVRFGYISAVTGFCASGNSGTVKLIGDKLEVTGTGECLRTTGTGIIDCVCNEINQNTAAGKCITIAAGTINVTANRIIASSSAYAYTGGTLNISCSSITLGGSETGSPNIIAASGNSKISGTLAVGGTTVSASKYINLDTTLASISASTYGSYINPVVTESNGNILMGQYVSAKSDDATSPGDCYAIQAASQYNSTGTIANVIGIIMQAYNNKAGTVTDMYCWYSYINNLHASGVVTNAYGVNIAGVSNSGTITNTYGLYIGDITAGTQTNQAYSIYLSDANTRNYIAGRLGIGVIGPSEMLDITGNIKISGTFTSNIATGTAPLVIASTTKVSNLNVDQVDGYDLNQDVTSGATPTFTGTNFTGIPDGGLTLTDVTTNNASTSAHGLLKKLDNNASNFMNGQGNWATPAAGISNVVEDTTPQLGGDLDTNEKNIHWDLPDANTEFSGNISTQTVDTNAVGLFALLHMAADFHFDEADADAESTCGDSIVLACETGTGSKKVMHQGWAFSTGWTWSAGKIYASVTQGEMTQTAPSGSGDVVRVVAHAYSANLIYFNPSNDYTVIA